mmetsp:Transcript_103900/g.318257  ORF Transcript_103900/g.318257 Transcript_103900/m.318257 type:complete len:277 (-) Transcript_103900:82-912(-)
MNLAHGPEGPLHRRPAEAEHAVVAVVEAHRKLGGAHGLQKSLRLVLQLLAVRWRLRVLERTAGVPAGLARQGGLLQELRRLLVLGEAETQDAFEGAAQAQPLVDHEQEPFLHVSVGAADTDHVGSNQSLDWSAAETEHHGRQGTAASQSVRLRLHLLQRECRRAIRPPEAPAFGEATFRLLAHARLNDERIAACVRDHVEALRRRPNLHPHCEMRDHVLQSGARRHGVLLPDGQTRTTSQKRSGGIQVADARDQRDGQRPTERSCGGDHRRHAVRK